jgi:class 3 adenylate cyclase
MTLEPKPRAILFADISGSTRLYEQLGDVDALARVETCLRLLQCVTEELGGRVVRSTGDGVLCAFDGAAPALHAARAMQVRVLEQQALGGPALAIHVGCHYGPAIDSGGDVYGDAVNVAARMAAVANVGQIIATQEVIARIDRTLREKTRRLDLIAVKGKRDPVEIHELVWQDSEDLTVLTRLTQERVPRLRLAFGLLDLRFDGTAQRALTLGREATCDIVIDDPKASRQHAKIERRRDKFVLVDHSSNGTFVAITGEAEIRLRREELILRRQGRIALGHHPDDAQAPVVEFSCE